MQLQRGAMMLGPRILGSLRPLHGALRRLPGGAIPAKEVRGAVRGVDPTANGATWARPGAAPRMVHGVVKQELHGVVIELVFVNTRCAMMYKR